MTRDITQERREIEGVEIQLADDGELLARGGIVARGYFRDAEKSAETCDADGWLHTSDVGTFEVDGYARIVDRKKNLITAGGKNISPANLESLLKQHPLVGQARAIGDRRPYRLKFSSIAQLATAPEVVAAVQEAAELCNRHVAQVEAIRRFTVLPVEWTAESDELAPTLKLKRRVVFAQYASQVEAMYAAPSPTG